MSGKFFDFLRSRLLIINILSAMAFVIIGGFIVSSFLNKFTHHGESISVPDIRGLKTERLENFLDGKNLKYKIIDPLFDLHKPPGTVLEQDPAPDSKVKEGRTIYLTINATQPPKVKMPNLIDVSFRQAEAILQSFGLKTGQLIYKPDLAKNAVLDQRYKGTSIKAGTEISKGTAIDLALGDGLGNAEVPVPDLSGLTRGEALFVLKGSSLNIGTVHYEGDQDSASATVYKQFPEPGNNNFINQGEAIDIYLR